MVTNLVVGFVSTRKQSMKTYRELSMSPNLLAFNMFASEMRLVLRDSSLLSRAEMQMGIEKVIGNRWKAMTPDEKEKHIDKARVEQARLIAEGGMPQAPASSGRGKKQKSESAGDAQAPPKRRRGRPPKAGTAPAAARSKLSQLQPLPYNGNVNNGNNFAYNNHSGGASMHYGGAFMDMHDDDDEDEDAHARDPYSLYNINDHANFHSMSDLFMPFNSSVSTPGSNNFEKTFNDASLVQPAPAAKDVSSFLQYDVVSALGGGSAAPRQSAGSYDLTGMSVEGVIDGTFDTGYYMTVRINGQVLRGMMYREEACMRAVSSHVNTLNKAAL